MSTTVNFGQTQPIHANNTTVAGVYLSLYAVHNTANTAFSANLCDLSAVNCELTLTRGGQSQTIFADNLQNLWAFSAMFSEMWKAIATNNQSKIKKVLVAAASEVNEIVVIPFRIDLPGVINLKGNDKLTFKVTVPTGSNATSVNANSGVSYFSVDFMEGVGIEWAVPKISSINIQANNSSFTEDLGNFVDKAAYLNYDKLSYLAADRTVSSLSLNSDKWTRTDDILELITKGQYQGYIPDAEFQPFQNYLLYASGGNINKVLNSVKLALSLNTSNITASKNWVIWSHFMPSPGLLRRAAAMAEKHQAENTRNLNR